MEDLIKELRNGNEVYCEDCLLYVQENSKEGLCRKHTFIAEGFTVNLATVGAYADACIDFVKK